MEEKTETPGSDKGDVLPPKSAGMPHDIITETLEVSLVKQQTPELETNVGQEKEKPELSEEMQINKKKHRPE